MQKKVTYSLLKVLFIQHTLQVHVAYESRSISRFDMSYAQAHWVGSKPIRRVVQLKLQKPTMAIGYSLRMCARHVYSTNPGRSNLVFRSKPIPEAEMSNRLNYYVETRYTHWDLIADGRGRICNMFAQSICHSNVLEISLDTSMHCPCTLSELYNIKQFDSYKWH